MKENNKKRQAKLVNEAETAISSVYLIPIPNLLSTKQLHPKKSENEDEEKKKEYET